MPYAHFPIPFTSGWSSSCAMLQWAGAASGAERRWGTFSPSGMTCWNWSHWSMNSMELWPSYGHRMCHRMCRECDKTVDGSAEFGWFSTDPSLVRRWCVNMHHTESWNIQKWRFKAIQSIRKRLDLARWESNYPTRDFTIIPPGKHGVNAKHAGFTKKNLDTRYSLIRRFPKIGVSPNHPFESDVP